MIQYAASMLKDHFILVAEDNEMNQKLIISILKKLGCQYKVVENGQAVLDSCLQNNFDLILMDCQMPIMDGLEATAKIREIEAQDKSRGRIPIVALTANAMKGDSDKCLSQGMDAFLSKPFKVPDLIQLIQTWILKSPVLKTKS